LHFVLPGQIQAKTSIDWYTDVVRMHCMVPLPPERTD
jgi:hypothetical protein